MELDLGEITYEVKPEKKKKGKSKLANTKVPTSPEEKFLMSQLPPATHSKYIQNDYEINVHAKYRMMNCGGKVPKVSVPMTIIP